MPLVFCTCPHGLKQLDSEDIALVGPSQSIVAAINKAAANHSGCAILQLDHIDWAFQDNKALHIQLWVKTLEEDIYGEIIEFLAGMKVPMLFLCTAWVGENSI